MVKVIKPGLTCQVNSMTRLLTQCAWFGLGLNLKTMLSEPGFMIMVMVIWKKKPLFLYIS
jgi:hypothetical protein